MAWQLRPPPPPSLLLHLKRLFQELRDPQQGTEQDYRMHDILQLGICRGRDEILRVVFFKPREI